MLIFFVKVKWESLETGTKEYIYIFLYIQGRHTLQFNLQMADIPDQCIFPEVTSFGHLVRWSFMQINKTRLLSICNAAESLHWLACK